MPTTALEEAHERRRQMSAVDALVVAIAERHEQAKGISSIVAEVVALKGPRIGLDRARRRSFRVLAAPSVVTGAALGVAVYSLGFSGRQYSAGWHPSGFPHR